MTFYELQKRKIKLSLPQPLEEIFGAARAICKNFEGRAGERGADLIFLSEVHVPHMRIVSQQVCRRL